MAIAKIDAPSRAVVGGSAASSWVAGLAGFFTFAWVAKRMREGRAIAELRRLSDRELNDMGISRSEIPFLVRGEIRRR